MTLRHVAALAALAALSVQAQASSTCNHERWNGTAWSLDGCDTLDLSCPTDPSRKPACANALLPAEVQPLASAFLAGSSVASLNLYGSPLGQAGAAVLIPALTDVHTLGLRSCRVGDRGARTLSETLLLPGAALRSLDLAHNSVSDDGVRLLATTLKGEGSLRSLDLRRVLQGLDPWTSVVPGPLCSLDLLWSLDLHWSLPPCLLAAAP